MMECLGRNGFSVAAMSGTVLESPHEVDPAEWLRETMAGSGPLVAIPAPEGSRVPMPDLPLAYRLDAGGVPVLLHRGPTTLPHEPDEAEAREFLGLFEGVLDQFRPDVVVNFGGNALEAEVRRLARAEGAAVVFALHNFNYRTRSPFQGVDAVIVPSRFAAAYYRKTLGLECRPLPNLVDFDRVRAQAPDPRYVTFVNPAIEKGVYVFARIADELGRRRPDIPLLVVEGRGTERTLVDCGLDLRAHGNVSVMAHTPDPRLFWGATKIGLLPSLWWENQPLAAIEAMINGIPVIGSDRGGIPEALGDGGIVLGLPQRLTPATRELPTAEEVKAWVKAIIALWDDPAAYQAHRERAYREAERWKPERLDGLYSNFFGGIPPDGRALVEPEMSKPTVPLPVESTIVDP
jgi:glycosyltransferase involved in cell wall biosynthesis